MMLVSQLETSAKENLPRRHKDIQSEKVANRFARLDTFQVETSTARCEGHSSSKLQKTFGARESGGRKRYYRREKRRAHAKATNRLHQSTKSIQQYSKPPYLYVCVCVGGG